jgi:hypothetical protein
METEHQYPKKPPAGQPTAPSNIYNLPINIFVLQALLKATPTQARHYPAVGHTASRETNPARPSQSEILGEEGTKH